MEPGRPHGTAAPRSEERLRALARSVVGDDAAAAIDAIRWRGEHSNDVFELDFADGRTLMLKLGRHPWSRTCFERSEAAGALLRAVDVVAPDPLPAGEPPADAPPLQAYWRIPLPTLAEAWPRLGDAGRDRAMRSLAALLHRVHAVELPGWGALRSARRDRRSLAAYISADLAERLLPAARGLWPEAGEMIQALAAESSRALGRHGDGPGCLAHNDVHLGNIVCRTDSEGALCVGVLDLDSAAAVPPEADLARLQVLHGPLFEQPIAHRWVEAATEAYPAPVDEGVLAFFRAAHLANLGFHSALVGDHEHAGLVAASLQGEVAALAEA